MTTWGETVGLITPGGTAIDLFNPDLGVPAPQRRGMVAGSYANAGGVGRDGNGRLGGRGTPSETEHQAGCQRQGQQELRGKPLHKDLYGFGPFSLA